MRHTPLHALLVRSPQEDGMAALMDDQEIGSGLTCRRADGPTD